VYSIVACVENIFFLSLFCDCKNVVKGIMLCGALFAVAHYLSPPLFSPILITFVLLAWNDVIGTTANAGIYIQPQHQFKESTCSFCRFLK